MKLTFDISATEFVIVRDILADIAPPECRIWVFGSRAKNQARFNSDLDLALECKDKLPPIILHRLKEAFNEAALAYRVDVLDINDVSKNFQTIIRQQAIAFPLAKSDEVPKLRFPEFSGEWKIARLGSRITKVGSGVTPKGGSDVYLNSGIPLLRSQNVRDNRLDLTDVAFVSDEINAKMKGSAVKPNDVLLNITGASIGRSCVVPSDIGTANVNQHVCIIRLVSDSSPNFLQSFLASHRGQKLIFQSQSGSGREGLNFENIKTFKAAFPTLPEQQKIAAFLSSIDRKIAQITKKKALLEQYKRGVMQKLFSQELRFKDAQGKGFPEWVEKRLNKIARKTASSVTAQSLEETPGKYPVFGASGIVGYVDFYNSAPPHISVVKDGAGIGRVFLCPKQSSVLGTLDSIIAYDRSHTAFVFYWLSQISFEPYRTGSTIPHVYFRDYGKKNGWFPHPDEQQKIADFLSAIDQKIDMVATQLNHAKTFKKGLLQQMFI